MKRHIFILIFLLLEISAWASVEIDGLFYNLHNDYINNDYTAEVTRSATGSKYSGSIVIPYRIYYQGQYYSVTSIGEYAFNSCDITDITIPRSVTSIGNSAFQGCDALSSIVIPKSVISIGDYFLAGCFRMCRIEVEPENTVYDSRNSCNAIIKTDENTLITGCKNTVIPRSVTAIGDGAFICTTLTSIIIPNSVTSIGNHAFQDCLNLISVSIPKSVTNIGNSVFKNCTTLNSVNIPNSITSIGDWVFADCSSLTSINIPNSVTSIGKDAFAGCSSLTSLTIPKSVSNIGVGAFFCDNLYSVNFKANIPPIIDYDIISSDKTVAHVPIGCKNAYENAAWFICDNIIEDIDLNQDECAAPNISIINGKIVAVSKTEDAKVHIKYSIANKGKFDDKGDPYLILKVSAYATKPDYSDSEEVTKEFDFLELANAGDLNGDGKYSAADITLLINKLSEK